MMCGIANDLWSDSQSLWLHFSVAVLEARKLKKMDITGASDPYVKIKLFDNKVKAETKVLYKLLCLNLVLHTVQAE